MASEHRLIAIYRQADRKQRDTMWFMYLGMQADFQRIEDTAKNKCAECGKNPHDAYCSKQPKIV
jgi:hypothetical protein